MAPFLVLVHMATCLLLCVVHLMHSAAVGVTMVVAAMEAVMVVAAGGSSWALKVILARGGTDFASFVRDVTRETDAIKQAHAAGAPVVGLVGDVHMHESGDFAGYVLDAVGTAFPADPRKPTKEQCRKALAALGALHSFRVAHGDARVPNLLLQSNNISAWVDLRDCLVTPTTAGEVHFRMDAATLMRSLLGLKDLDSTLMTAVKKYSASVDAATSQRAADGSSPSASASSSSLAAAMAPGTATATSASLGAAAAPREIIAAAASTLAADVHLRSAHAKSAGVTNAPADDENDDI